jgi:hypothetical protein
MHFVPQINRKIAKSLQCVDFQNYLSVRVAEERFVRSLLMLTRAKKFINNRETMLLKHFD